MAEHRGFSGRLVVFKGRWYQVFACREGDAETPERCMHNDLRILLPQLLPRAISWAETVAAEVATSGTPLSDDGLSVASSVEVSHPSRVRILMVDRFPKPSDPELQTAASQAGLLGPTTTGLTLGYSVLIKNGHMSRRLLSHECRHVYQFEQAGSIVGVSTIVLRIDHSVRQLGFSI